MKGMSMWLTKGIGLCTILCTVAVAPATAGRIFGAGSATEVRSSQKDSIALHPNSDPVARQGIQTMPQGGTPTQSQRLQGGPEEPIEGAEMTEDQAPTATAGRFRP